MPCPEKARPEPVTEAEQLQRQSSSDGRCCLKSSKNGCYGVTRERLSELWPVGCSVLERAHKATVRNFIRLLKLRKMCSSRTSVPFQDQSVMPRAANSGARFGTLPATALPAASTSRR